MPHVVFCFVQVLECYNYIEEVFALYYILLLCCCYVQQNGLNVIFCTDHKALRDLMI